MCRGLSIACFVASAMWLAPGSARACSVATPPGSEYDLGPMTIPQEGAIVAFAGPGQVGLPLLAERIEVVDAEGVAVPGRIQQSVGSSETGDLLVWLADEPLTPNATYEATLTGYDPQTRSFVAASEPLMSVEAPTLVLDALIERPVTIAQLCCELHSCQQCIPSQFEYRPSIELSWSEPDVGDARRYLRYEWLLGPSPDELEREGFEGTTLSGERSTQLSVDAAPEAARICVALEVHDVFGDLHARSDVMCLDLAEVEMVAHDQPEPAFCGGDGMPTPRIDEGLDDSDSEGDGGCRVSSSTPPLALTVALLFGLGAVRLQRRGLRRRARTGAPRAHLEQSASSTAGSSPPS